MKRGPLSDVAPSDWHRVVLDERGDEWTSTQLAERLRVWERSVPGVAFLVGDADGHHPEDRARAHELWSQIGRAHV